MKSSVHLLCMIVLFFLCTSVSVYSQKALDGPYRFSLPDIPSFIADQGAKMSYLGSHFWDNYDFSNNEFIRTEEGHRVFSYYISLLLKLPEHESGEDIGSLMEKARTDSTTCMELFSGAEQLLYDPNSPLRNETLYMRVLEKMLLWQKLDDIHKSRPQFQYLLACRNRPGKTATNFTYTLESGKEGKLKNICSEYVLLYFNNPGCGDCKRVKKLMENSLVINHLIEGGKLKVLSIYPDENLEAWKKAKGTMPKSWIISYDRGAVIKKKNLYDLRAMPTLYLLDKQKKVIEKDAPFERIEEDLKKTDTVR